jgi:hypothetical protein
MYAQMCQPWEARKPFACPLLGKMLLASSGHISETLFFLLLSNFSEGLFYSYVAAGKGVFRDLGLMKHLVTLFIIKMYL